MWILLILILSLISCSAETEQNVTLYFHERTPFENLYQEDMYYTLKYFDGSSIRSVFLQKGQREITIPVKQGGLRIFVLYPLSTLSPLGGFYEGKATEIVLREEYGWFSETLLNAAEYRAKAIERLSFENLKKNITDFSSLNTTSFLKDLYDGTLSNSSLTANAKYKVAIEGILPGYWTSERYSEDDFYQRDYQPVFFYNYPGIYRYSKEGLLLTVVIGEDGTSYSNIKELDSWF